MKTISILLVMLLVLAGVGYGLVTDINPHGEDLTSCGGQNDLFGMTVMTKYNFQLISFNKSSSCTALRGYVFNTTTGDLLINESFGGDNYINLTSYNLKINANENISLLVGSDSGAYAHCNAGVPFPPSEGTNIRWENRATYDFGGGVFTNEGTRQYSNIVSIVSLLPVAAIGSCNVYGDLLVNITFYDENTRILMPVNTTGTMTYSVPEQDLTEQNYSFIQNQVTNITICTNQSFRYIYDIYLQHEGVGEVTERYYVINSTVNSTSPDLVHAYNFVDDTGLSELESTLLNYYYNYYPNVLMQMQRYYPGINTWISVQNDKSDEFGKGLFYVYQNSADYRYVWILGGGVLDQKATGASTAPLKFICDSATECAETFVIESDAAADSYEGMTFNYSYNNNTGIVILSWIDINNLVDNVRILVEEQRADRHITICDNNISAASGSLTCNVSTYTGLITVRGYRSASPEAPFISKIIDKIEQTLKDLLKDSGIEKDGVFFGFIIMLVVAGFGATSAVTSVILGIFGLIIMFYLGIVSFVSFSFVVGGIALGIIVAYMVKR